MLTLPWWERQERDPTVSVFSDDAKKTFIKSCCGDTEMEQIIILGGWFFWSKIQEQFSVGKEKILLQKSSKQNEDEARGWDTLICSILSFLSCWA